MQNGKIDPATEYCPEYFPNLLVAALLECELMYYI
jgi:hypothetical protein